MPYNKEREWQPNVDEVALREVESYVEKIEKQTETSISDDKNNNSSNVPLVSQKGQSSNTNQNDLSAKKKIVLPIVESEVVDGLKAKPSLGLKWLSEWCLMMIKKYPGRVFYSPSRTYE